MERRNKILTVSVIIYILCYYLWIFLYDGNDYIMTLGENIFSVVGAVASIILLVVTYNNCKENQRHYWLFLLLAAIFYTIGDLIWFHYELYFGAMTAYIGWFDVFYLIQSAFYISAIVSLAGIKNSPYSSAQRAFSLLTVFTIMISLSWYFLLKPIDPNVTINWLYQWVISVYPVVNLIVILMALGIYTSPKKKEYTPKYMGRFIWGMAVSTLADVIYLYLLRQNLQEHIDFVNPLWILGLILISLSGIKSIERDKLYIPLLDKWRISDHRANQPYIIMPYISIALLLVIMLNQIGKIDGILISLVVAVMLAIVQQIFVLLENKRLMLELENTQIALQKSRYELELANQELKTFSIIKEKEADLDFLTNLFNRRYIDKKLREYFGQLALSNKGFCILLIDIDHFKIVNDSLGHKSGDIVLRQIADILKQTTRTKDIIGRFGGEEFIVILPNTSVAIGRKIAERIRKAIAEYNFFVSQQKLKISVSVGVTSGQSLDTCIDSLVTRADKALYQAKAQGRNCIVLY